MVLVSPWPRSDPTPTRRNPGVAINFDYEDLSDAQFDSHMNAAFPKSFFDHMGLVSLVDTHRRFQIQS